jgi:hypothetical protein
MKIRSVGSDLFHADGWTDIQTDMTMLMVAFRSCAKRPKSVLGLLMCSGPYRVACGIGTYLRKISFFL